VLAHGGTGGDISLGTGGAGGTGSANTYHENGGAGGSPGNGNTGYDDPLSNFTDTNVFLWYPMNDAAGSGNVQDTSGSGQTGEAVNVTQGATAPGVFPQPVQNVTNSALCAQFTGDSYILGPTLPQNLSAYTISVWVNNNGLGYGGQNMRLIANDHPQATNRGIDLYIGGTGSSDNTKGVIYAQAVNLAGNAMVQAVSNSSLGANGWTGWHMITMTWNGSTITLYVDGVAQTTTGSTARYWYGASTTQDTSFGFNPQYGGDYFQGYMANGYAIVDAYLTSVEITALYGVSSPTGGSGGGASGGYTGAGNPGAVPASSSSGAAGAGVAGSGTFNGSGTGGAGGAVGLSGAQGSLSGYDPTASYSYGGGGGGAGASTAPTTSVLTITPTTSGTYGGPDATGGQAYTLQNSSPSNGTIIQGGQVASQGAFNGTQIGVLLLPTNVLSELKGTTIQKVTLTFQTISGNGATINLGYSNYTSLPATDTTPNPVLTPVALKSFKTTGGNGKSVSYDLSATTLKTALQAGTATALTFGNGATGAYNSSSASAYYAQIAGVSNANIASGAAPVLTVVLTTSSAKNGGAGAPGAIAVSYITQSGVPVCSILNSTEEDSYNNQYAAGYTGPVTAFQPGSSPLMPETWHSLSLVAGWAVGSNGWAKYKLTAQNTVRISLALFTIGTKTDGTTIATLPTGYIPVTAGHSAPLVLSGSGLSASANRYGPQIDIGTSGVLQVWGINVGTVTFVGGEIEIPLDI
jgi:hypothetical protein